MKIDETPFVRRAAELCLPPTLSKPCLRRREAAEYLLRVHGIEIASTTLAKYASIGGGPAYHKSGRTPLYPTEELDQWAIQRLGPLVRHSSEVVIGGRT